MSIHAAASGRNGRSSATAFQVRAGGTCNGRFALTWPQGSNGNQDRGRLLPVAEKKLGRWGLRFSGLFSDAFLSSLANLAH